MKIKELFSDSSKWTKGACAKTKHYTACLPTNPSAVCWCLAGALRKCYGESGESMSKIRLRILRSLGADYIVWNDDPTRTFEEVKALVEELDI